MATLNRTVPASTSTLNPSGFFFSIQKFPEISYFIQEAPLPGISLGQALQVSSVHDIKTPGETLEYQDITISFLVDEYMDNYKAIHDWMVGLGFPEQHKQFRDFMSDSRNAAAYKGSDASRSVSDCFLTIMNNDNVASHRFSFVDAFPTELSGLTFQSTASDVQYLVATVTLAYSYYTITNVELPGKRNAIWLSLHGNELDTSIGSVSDQSTAVDIGLVGTFSLGGIENFDKSSYPYGAASTDIVIQMTGIETVGTI